MDVVARTRTRASAPPPPPKPKCPWDIPVVGGPVAFLPLGRPLFSEGKATSAWPYMTGSEFIGYTLCETRNPRQPSARLFHHGTDIVYLHCHAWQERGGQLRYLGSFGSREAAVRAILAAKAASPAVQPVAARTRIRAVPK